MHCSDLYRKPEHSMKDDHEVSMAKSDLYKTAKYAQKIYMMMKDLPEDGQIPGWVQSKITKSADYMGSVYHYLDHKSIKDKI